MQIDSKEAYSILGVVGGEEGAIISKSGGLTVSYMIQEPEVYSLYKDDIEERKQKFYQAFKNLPDKTIVHKQEVFLKKKYDVKQDGKSFLSKAEERHFHHREFLEHHSILSFSLFGIEDLEKGYVANPFSWKQSTSKRSQEAIALFLDAVEGAVNIIGNIRDTSITQMSDSQIKEYLFAYCNGFNGDNGMRDIHFKENLTIGESKGMFFSVSDENYIPDTISVAKEDNTLPDANTFLFMSELEGLGTHILCNHVVNQIIWFQGNAMLKQELESRVKLYGQYSQFDTAILQQSEKLKELRNEIFEENKILVRTSLSVMIWDDDEDKLRHAADKVKEVFRNADFKYYIPSYEGIKNQWIGSIIGRENKLSKDYFFLTDLDVALCLWLHQTTFKDDDEGLFFNDRLYQIPLRKDIWDAKKKRMPARNAIVMASTGGGKSVATLNIVQQMIEQDYKIIVCEFGKSFEQLTRVYPDISLHIDYDGEQPLGINPFFLDGEKLTNDKIVTLSAIILKYWRSRAITSDTNQVVSLRKIVKHYYDKVHEKHSFPSFYHFIKDNFNEIIKELDILEEFFDIKSFLHVCSDFMPGGIYENICKESKFEETMKDKSFIVFELTKIKKDPFLASLIMSILFETIENKILADKSTRGMLVFDEYAETQAMKDVFSGDDVHMTVAFCYQKLRKENGAIMTIVQNPAQLPNNEYTKTILSNTQLLYVLPTTELVYSQIVESFEIKNPSHINLMKSIRNDFSSDKPHSEIYIRFQDSYNIVVRLELSKERFYSFQTDGDDWKAINDRYHVNGNMEETINDYVKFKK